MGAPHTSSARRPAAFFVRRMCPGRGGGSRFLHLLGSAARKGGDSCALSYGVRSDDNTFSYGEGSFFAFVRKAERPCFLNRDVSHREQNRKRSV